MPDVGLEVAVSVLIETSLADGSCRNPDCCGRAGHDGPCWPGVSDA